MSLYSTQQLTLLTAQSRFCHVYDTRNQRLKCRRADIFIHQEDYFMGRQNSYTNTCKWMSKSSQTSGVEIISLLLLLLLLLLLEIY